MTAIVPVFGYLLSLGLSRGHIPVSDVWLDITVLAVVGFLVHVFGFVHNEYMDRKFDSMSPIHGDKPLVSGTVKPGLARFLIFFSIIASTLIVQLYFNDLEGTLLLTIAILMGAIYNIYGKKIPGMDIFLGGWAFFYFCSGARMAAPLSREIFLFGGMAGLQILFNNGIIGGLKDADTDLRSGAITMATALGVMGDEHGLNIPVSFRSLGWLIKLFQLSMGFIIILHYGLTTDIAGPEKSIIIGISILLALIMFVCQAYAFGENLLFLEKKAAQKNRLDGLYSLREKKDSRKKMLRIFAIHEISAVCFILIASTPFTGGLLTAALILVPLSWFVIVNRCLYGTTLVPRI